MSAHPLDRVDRQPLTCIWEITGACNLHCVHCGNHCGPVGSNELSFDQMVRVADSLARLGCRMVDITGGEPLLHPEWDKLARVLKERGMQTALITNGTLLDEAALDRAVEAGVKVIAISIDGLKEVHDRTRKRVGPGPSPWEESIRGLRRAQKRVNTKVITQVNQHNLHQLRDLRAFFAKLGVLVWQIQLAIPTGRLLQLDEPYVIAPEDLDGLTDFIVEAVHDDALPRIDTSDTIGYYTQKEPGLRKRQTGQGVWLGCQAGVRAVAITYNGCVRGCSLMPSEFDAGDLQEESLEKIWADVDRFAFSTCFDPHKLTGSCARCRFGALCRAGCTTMAYWTTGTIYENPYCLSGQKGQGLSI